MSVSSEWIKDRSRIWITPGVVVLVVKDNTYTASRTYTKELMYVQTVEA